MSCLAFYLKNNVPSDPVEIILSLQGIDETDEDFSEAYDAKMIELGMNLPSFYFSIQSNYTSWIDNYEGESSTKRFATELANRKYKKVDILELISIASQLHDKEKRTLLICQTPQEVVERLDRPQLASISSGIKSSIKILSAKMEINKVRWHYPTASWHGLKNQYHYWVSSFIIGDFGVSLVDAQPVFKKIWNSMRWTLMLLIISLGFAGIISFIIGIYNGVNQGSKFDRWSNAILFLFYSIPKFWLATLMIIFFTTAEYGNWTNIFPSVGDWPSMTGFFDLVTKSANKLILPVLVIVIPDVAYLSRLIRASVIEEKNKEYIKTARSKGIPKRQIVLHHLVPNSMIPTITLLAGVIPGALGSSLIIEVIFNIPGIGRLMFESIKSADWAIVFPIIMIVSILTVIVFLVADILIAWLNPKIKLG
ncbi:MAG: peptide/nickel transport system permease protein [Saprospiraceae bacterium]